MKKHGFGTPIVMSFPGIDDGGDETEMPGGSSTGGIGGNGGNKAPFVCTFDTWLDTFASDTYKDGMIDFNDYGQWWADSGLGLDAWDQVNPGKSFEWKANK
jgi:hypothetical protein